MSTATYRTYLIQLTAALGLAIAGIVAALWLLNPYKLYPGGSRQQPADLFWQLRLHKPYAMQQQRAQQLIIGSSRAARLSPATLASTGGNAYNAALPGISLLEIARMIEHADAITPLQRVIVGLDYYMFRPGHNSTSFVDDRLLKIAPTLTDSARHAYQVVQDHWSSLLSTDALLAAYSNAAGRQFSQRHFSDDGTWVALVPPHRAGNPVYRMLTTQKYREFSTQQDGLDMSGLQAVLDYAQQRNIELLLLISPLHALPLNAIWQAGKWQSYLDWQRQLARVIAEHPARASLYGLEDNVDLLTHPIAGPAAQFKDGVHYTAETGTAISQCLAQQIQHLPCAGNLLLAALNPANIDSYLASVTQIMRGYATSNPGDYALLERIVAEQTQ